MRTLREAADMTQEELAQAAGISKVFLGTVERAEKSVSLETVEKIAGGLGVTMPALFGVTLGEGSDAAAKLGHRVAVLAKGFSEEKLRRFERIARLFFVDERKTGTKKGARPKPS